MGTNTGLKAIDASTGTRWESASADPQSITLDLGQNRYVGRVVLDWEAASAKDYVIELSTDNATWSLAKTLSIATSVNHRIDTLTGLTGSPVARYVRMRGTTRTTPYGYSLCNFAVYGDNNPSCTSSCVPSCTGKVCGNDGCGGSCGTCGTGLTCNASSNHRIDTLTALTGPQAARYVRLRGTTRTTQYGYSLWDFAVYGDVNPSCGP